MQAVSIRFIVTLLSIVGCQALFVNLASATSVGLSDLPLYVTQGVEPNIFLSVDDSTSMLWAHLPDAIGTEMLYDTKRAKSSTINKLYYDPDVTYLPAVDANGASLGNSNFTSAWNDGFNQSGNIKSGSCTIDLSSAYRPSWCGPNGVNNCDSTDDQWEDWRDGTEVTCPEYAGAAAAAPAYYYEYKGTGDKDDDESYSERTLVTDEDKQNFANWYSYYRTRMLAAKTAISRSFAKLGPVFRISTQTINNQTLTPLSEFSGQTRTRFFEAIKDIRFPNGYTPLRSALQNVGETLAANDDPYRDDPSDSDSPIRSCRQNFHILMTDGGWNTKGDPENLNVEDEQDYFTVGGNLDNESLTLGDGTTAYSSRAPYSDANNNFLADVAFKYWYSDLREKSEGSEGLANNVPTSEKTPVCSAETTNCTKKSKGKDTVKTFWHPDNDPATWQHLVNYTIGFGIGGVLSDSDFDGLMAGTTAWGNNHVDDLWHAAINSRGRYLSATDPDALVASFTSALKSVLDTSSSAAPVSLNSGSVSSVSRLYQATFDTSDWSGRLYSKPISNGSTSASCTSEDAIGDVCAPEWEAGCMLDGGDCVGQSNRVVGLDWDTGREIITYKLGDAANTGIAFTWNSLNSEQQSLLNGDDEEGQERGEDRLSYLRGDKTFEASNFSNSCSGCTFRNRNSLLGDLIHSNPTYVGAPSRIYPDNLEAIGHSTYRAEQSSRAGMIYVGGNDGMLHAFASNDGTEKLAYVPNMVFPKLASLTNKNYSHTSFVDGQLDEGDVYFGSAWHTVLVGGLGYGGQGIYALDITRPGNFSESRAASIVLWEYSDATDDDSVDLGYTYGQPVIRKLNNNKWAAIFGNGYDSTTADGHVSTSGDAAIFIVDIETGSLIKKISTETGTAEDPTGASRPNGITGIQPVDINGDFKIDYLYAGDLFGNVWRFNLVSDRPSSWEVAFNRRPLYTAKDSVGNAQPITTITAVGRHETYMGTMVYFGTGKYLGVNDVTDTSRQTFYGIWDRWFDNDADTTHNEDDLAAFDRSSLLEQDILATREITSAGTVQARVTTNKSINWASQKGWYLDLTESGERVFQSPILRNGRIIFVTVTPSSDPCVSGGSSWLMELNAASGSRLDMSPFDYNGDGIVNEEDQITYDVDGDGAKENIGGSGIRLNPTEGGIYTTPAVVNLPSGGKERKYIGTSKAKIEAIDESSHKRLNLSWREIMECGI